MGSACYVYAIVGRDTPLPVTGGAELAMVRCRELAAVTARIEDDRARAAAPITMDAVRHHEAVVEAVRRQGPALPVRFGTGFRDADAVARSLAERYAPLAADLERLGDKVELGLTALWAEPASVDAPDLAARHDEPRAGWGAGARYLQARAAQARRDDALRDGARAVVRELDEAVGSLALERRVSLLPTSRIAVRAAYLLDPARVDAFHAAFETMRRARAELRLLLTGPWPPYSFVRRTESGDGAASGGRLDALVRLLTDEMKTRRG